MLIIFLFENTNVMKVLKDKKIILLIVTIPFWLLSKLTDQ